MAEIRADYLGGDPLAPVGHGASGLLLTSGGGLSFRGAAVDATLRPSRVAVAIAATDIGLVSLGSADSARGTGSALTGPIEAAADAAGGRDHLLVVSGRREGTAFLTTFGVTAGDGARLVDAMERARAERGHPAAGRLAGPGGDAEDHRLLVEIRDLLREQTRLLRERGDPAGPREA